LGLCPCRQKAKNLKNDVGSIAALASADAMMGRIKNGMSIHVAFIKKTYKCFINAE